MSFADILHGTPVWVWVLLVFLLSRGFKALNSGTVPLARLAIFPILFAGWGIIHLASYPAQGWTSAPVWVVSAVVGIAAGIQIARRTRFLVDANTNTVMVPGSIVPLLLILATFVTKFWLGFELATAGASSVGAYLLIDAAVSGLVAGIFGGRFFTYWNTLNKQRQRITA